MESSSVFYGIVFVFLIGKKVVERQRSAEGGRERQWRGEESCECLEVNVQKSGNGGPEMSVQLQTRVFFSLYFTCEEPHPSVWAYPIAQPAYESPCKETQQRTQRLPVGRMKTRVARSFPQSGDPQTQLHTDSSEKARDPKRLRGFAHT